MWKSKIRLQEQILATKRMGHFYRVTLWKISLEYGKRLAWNSWRIPESTRSWLIFFFPPHNCDVEVDPEEDVDDEDGDEGPRHVGDVASAPLQLQPDISSKHQANALKIFELIMHAA